jgi:polar amino acid transport system permease protein
MNRAERETVAAIRRDGELTVVPLRHPGRWVAATVLTVALGGTLWSFAKNQNVSWPTVGTFLFNGLILHGIVVTLYLTVVAMVIGVIGGTLVATMRTSKNPIVSSIAKAYVWFFRGTPILIQIIFWGYFGAIYPRIAIGIPFTHVTWFSEQSSSLITATMAAILSLGMNEIAYSSEIVRGGINGVTRGQTEAAYSLGLTPAQTTRRVVLPQAMRIIIPPMGNEVLTMLKETSLVSVIAGRDLMTADEQIYSQNYRVIPLLVVAGLWYLLLTSLLSIPQRRLERHFGRSAVAAGQSGLARMLAGGLASRFGSRT